MLNVTSDMRSLSPMRDDDVALLAPIVREADSVETRKMSNHSPVAALRLNLRASKFAFCLRDGAGAPVAAFGVGWLANPRAGLVWCLTSDAVGTIGLALLRECRALMADVMQGHDVLSTHVHSGNEASIRRLKWLGFEILSETTTPHSDGDLFFEMATFRDKDVRDLYVNRDWVRFAASRSFTFSSGLRLSDGARV